MSSEGKCRSLEVSSTNVLQITSEDCDLRDRAAFKFSKVTTPICNTLLRIMYIMLNFVLWMFTNRVTIGPKTNPEVVMQNSTQ